ncbi:hypothetical protein TOPH_01961 [Tolypocladium ophioglossoides CBS 100239]|uniref:Uncharacterized protein n=1 Tax=Tolypocladium ophioglossoides (strain CBS 100239) TaxID=1163406 RepID=A0A0L0NIC0_TOLOC|nr:hypothetical protein TOPH_01961 [Tolypocladium ophioglossoides CBS 100239]
MDENELEFDDSNARAVYDVYGPRVDFPQQPPRPQTRRRPLNIKPLIAPLEQVFDPKITANYEDNARAFYGGQAPPPATDLPLRNDSENLTVRESLIDLDASLDGQDLSRFVDLETIKAGARSVPNDLTGLDHRRTKDWKFPMMAMAPASASLDMPRSQPNNDDYVSTTQVSTTSDQLVGQRVADVQLNRASALSLIDLDASLLSEVEETTRPSTAGSDNISTGSDTGYTPFDLERHMFGTDSLPSTVGAPSIYVPDGIGVRKPSIYVLVGIGFEEQSIHVSDASPVLGKRDLGNTFTVLRNGAPETAGETHPADSNSMPSLPPPPSTNAMLGTSSPEELKGELHRIISSLSEHFQFTTESLAGLPVRRGE